MEPILESKSTEMLVLKCAWTRVQALKRGWCYKLIFLCFSFSFSSIYPYIFQYCLGLFTFLLSYPKVHWNSWPEHDCLMITTHVMHDPCWTVNHFDLLSNPSLLTDSSTDAFIVSCIAYTCTGYRVLGTGYWDSVYIVSICSSIS